MQHLLRLSLCVCVCVLFLKPSHSKRIKTVVYHVPRPARAFDTLAKALHPADSSAGESLEATMQLMSGDQSGPVVELEGSLLSDIHIPFKVPLVLVPTKTRHLWCSGATGFFIIAEVFPLFFSLLCLCLRQSTSTSTTSASRRLGCFSSRCTGLDPFLPFKPFGGSFYTLLLPVAPLRHTK